MGTGAGLRWKWYAELFRDREIIKALVLYLFGGFIVINNLNGYRYIFQPSVFTMWDFWGKKFALNINYLPVLNPDIVTGIALMTLFLYR